jgi:hypothetical protein
MFTRHLKIYLLSIVLLFTLEGLFSQPGDLYFFCFTLVDSAGDVIAPTTIENNYQVSFCSKYNSDSCYGVFYNKENEGVKYSCIMTSAGNIPSSEHIISIVNGTDTLRLYYTYETFNAEDPQLILNLVMFVPGNYIIKRSVDINDWQHYRTRPYKIRKVKGNKQKFLQKVLKD